MISRMRFQLASAGACCFCVLGLCPGVKWLKQAVSNLCFPPQGRQGPEWSDIRHGASASLIERYGSVSWNFCHYCYCLSFPFYKYLYISHLLFYVNISFFPFFLIPSVLLCSPVCLSLCLPSPRYTPLVTGSLFDLSNGMLKQKNGWGFYFYPIDSRWTG